MRFYTLGFLSLFTAFSAFSQFDSNDIQFWTGEGPNECIFVIDFLDENPSSFAWGFRFSETTTGAEALAALAAVDSELIVEAGAFLNDIVYGDFQGIGGAPNFWGTWSKTTEYWFSNTGLAEEINDGDWFGCSYTDFSPALEPNNPVAAPQPFGSGPFSPAAGEEGSDAVPVDQEGLVWLEVPLEIDLGPLQLGTGDGLIPTVGDENSAVGVPDADVLSLGDGGIAQVNICCDYTLINAEGPDFVIVENAFGDTFLELAFVEASNDGENWYRFPARSLTQTAQQIDGFGELDPTYIHNLAGKYRAGYGTPFDLEDLADEPGFDPNLVQYLRVVDVVGSIDPEYASTDSQGNVVNDPFPTPFASSGFDLDAIGLINFSVSVNENETTQPFSFFPNPAKEQITLLGTRGIPSWSIIHLSGQVVLNGRESVIDLSALSAGVYFLQVDGFVEVQKLIVD